MPSRVEQRFGKVASLIKGGAAVIALLPGIVTLLGLVNIPPSVGTLVTFICVFVGLSSLIVTALLSGAIRRASGLAIVVIVVLLALIGAGTSTAYYIFAQNHVISIGEDKDKRILLIPLHPSDKIRSVMRPYQGDYAEALETSSQRLYLSERLAKEGAGTAVLLVLLLVVAQAASVGAVVVGAWKLSYS